MQQQSLTSKEVLNLLEVAKKELEASDSYKKVKELETLYQSLSQKEYEVEVQQIKNYYTNQGYECRDITNCEIEFSKDYIGYEHIYNYIILPSSLPEVRMLVINGVCTQDFIIFKDGSKHLLGDVVIGNSDTEEDAWDDIYVSTVDREHILRSAHIYE